MVRAHDGRGESPAWRAQSRRTVEELLEMDMVPPPYEAHVVDLLEDDRPTEALALYVDARDVGTDGDRPESPETGAGR